MFHNLFHCEVSVSKLMKICETYRDLHIFPDAYTHRSDLMLVTVSFTHKIEFDM